MKEYYYEGSIEGELHFKTYILTQAENMVP